MIGVAIVASSPAVRAGLRVLLASDAALRVIGDGAALDELRHAPLSAAEIVVVQGIPPTSTVLPESVRGVLLLVDEWPAGTPPPVLAPTWAVLPTDAAADELINAVTTLYNGLIVIHPHLAPQLLAQPESRITSDNEPLVEPLTSREREVLQLIGQGLANKMIADRLHISEHTVKFHVSAIYAKLGVASRTEAVRAGARRGLIVL